MVLITIPVSGCLGSNETATPYQAPPLDPRDEAVCYDPGIGQEAIDSLGRTRVALADCRKKHQNVISQYNQVRERLGREG